MLASTKQRPHTPAHLGLAHAPPPTKTPSTRRGRTRSTFRRNKKSPGRRRRGRHECVGVKPTRAMQSLSPSPLMPLPRLNFIAAAPLSPGLRRSRLVPANLTSPRASDGERGKGVIFTRKHPHVKGKPHPVCGTRGGSRPSCQHRTLVHHHVRHTCELPTPTVTQECSRKQCALSNNI